MNRTIGLMLALAFAGCSSLGLIERRAQEKAAYLSTLPSSTQERIRQGRVELGDAPDAVYIALGQPNEVKEEGKDSSKTIVWIYGQEQMRTPRPISVGANSPDILHKAVYENDLNMAKSLFVVNVRLTFVDGKVTDIWIRKRR